MSRTRGAHSLETPALAADSPYRVGFDGRFKIADAATAPPEDAPRKPARKKTLIDRVEEISSLQHRLYADNCRALLLVFQAMDAAGKDSTIRAVLSGVDPAGCQVYSFKKPSTEELQHDFLWRTSRCLPEHGHIGVFNRSYYEEVLAVRVHPEFLQAQKIGDGQSPSQPLWNHRLESIRDHERHLARNGTVILKFWLNVSLEEQRQRLLSRLEQPRKNWKFEAADLAERALWPDYMAAYEDALRQTSRAEAPWYAIPADSKSFMRMTVAGIVADTLRNMQPQYPEISTEQEAEFQKLQRQLERDRS